MTPDALPDAVHEAGHAVAFLACGARFHHAELFPAGGGVVAIDSWSAVPARVRAVVSHAGPLAEARWQVIRHRTPGPPDGAGAYFEHTAYTEGGHRDLDVIRGALGELGLTADADPFRGQARELLRVHWRAIERVALALTEHRELSYRAVVDLTGRITP